ncbi:MAG: hypothetical protein HYZ83_03605 [Candidatus Omnitrophica bacterium]|nr:hypothetical protein [Candidatus Omnitrophota bacterium]
MKASPSRLLFSPIDIPAEFGTLEIFHQGKTDKPFVIYLQDAHGVTDAQKNIQRLIEYLSQKYQVPLVALEGVKGKLDATLLRAFPDPVVAKKVLGNYLQQGELTGPEMAAIFDAAKTLYHGIEDWPIYEQNYRAYADAARQKNKLEQALGDLRRELEERRKEIYSPGLNEFHEKIMDFREGKIDFLELWQFLKFTPNDENFARYPQLFKFAGAIAKQENLPKEKMTFQGEAVFDELEKYTEEQEAKLVTNDKERALSRDYQHWLLLKNIAKLELTRNEWEQIKHNSSFFTQRPEFAFLLKPFIEFYQTAEKRDQALHQKLELLMKKQKARAAIVLAGGFHKKGFEAMLREKGYSYAVVSPRMDSFAGQEKYHKIMQGNVSYRSYLSTTFYDGFMRHAALRMMDGLSEAQFRKNLKLWRDELMRNLAREGRLAKAGEYTRYIDILYKVHRERFGNKNPLAHEQILKRMEKEIDHFAGQMAERFWKKSQAPTPSALVAIHPLDSSLSRSETRTLIAAMTARSEVRGKTRDEILGNPDTKEAYERGFGYAQADLGDSDEPVEKMPDFLILSLMVLNLNFIVRGMKAGILRGITGPETSGYWTAYAGMVKEQADRAAEFFDEISQKIDPSGERFASAAKFLEAISQNLSAGIKGVIVPKVHIRNFIQDLQKVIEDIGSVLEGRRGSVFSRVLELSGIAERLQKEPATINIVNNSLRNLDASKLSAVEISKVILGVLPAGHALKAILQNAIDKGNRDFFSLQMDQGEIAPRAQSLVQQAWHFNSQGEQNDREILKMIRAELMGYQAGLMPQGTEVGSFLPAPAESVPAYPEVREIHFVHRLLSGEFVSVQVNSAAETQPLTSADASGLLLDHFRTVSSFSDLAGSKKNILEKKYGLTVRKDRKQKGPLKQITLDITSETGEVFITAMVTIFRKLSQELRYMPSCSGGICAVPVELSQIVLRQLKPLETLTPEMAAEFEERRALQDEVRKKVFALNQIGVAYSLNQRSAYSYHDQIVKTATAEKVNLAIADLKRAGIDILDRVPKRLQGILQGPVIHSYGDLLELSGRLKDVMNQLLYNYQYIHFTKELSEAFFQTVEGIFAKWIESVRPMDSFVEVMPDGAESTAWAHEALSKALLALIGQVLEYQRIILAQHEKKNEEGREVEERLWSLIENSILHLKVQEGLVADSTAYGLVQVLENLSQEGKRILPQANLPDRGKRLKEIKRDIHYDGLMKRARKRPLLLRSETRAVSLDRRIAEISAEIKRAHAAAADPGDSKAQDMMKKLTEIPSDVAGFREWMLKRDQSTPAQKLLFKIIFQRGIFDFPADEFLPVVLAGDDVLGWSFHNPPFAHYLHNPSELKKDARIAAYSDFHDSTNQKLRLLFLRPAEKVMSLFATIHELAHGLVQSEDSRQMSAREPLVNAIVEGFQPYVEIELLVKLLSSAHGPELIEILKDELLDVADKTILKGISELVSLSPDDPEGHQEEIEIIHRFLNLIFPEDIPFIDRVLASVDGEMKFWLILIIAVRWLSIIDYPEDKIFVRSMKRQLGEDLVRGIHRAGDLRDLHSLLGQNRFQNLTVLFQWENLLQDAMEFHLPKEEIPQVEKLVKNIRNAIAQKFIFGMPSPEFERYMRLFVNFLDIIMFVIRDIHMNHRTSPESPFLDWKNSMIAKIPEFAERAADLGGGYMLGEKTFDEVFAGVSELLRAERSEVRTQKTAGQRIHEWEEWKRYHPVSVLKEFTRRMDPVTFEVLKSNTISKIVGSAVWGWRYQSGSIDVQDFLLFLLLDDIDMVRKCVIDHMIREVNLDVSVLVDHIRDPGISIRQFHVPVMGIRDDETRPDFNQKVAFRNKRRALISFFFGFFRGVIATARRDVEEVNQLFHLVLGINARDFQDRVEEMGRKLIQAITADPDSALGEDRIMEPLEAVALEYFRHLHVTEILGQKNPFEWLYKLIYREMFSHPAIKSQATGMLDDWENQMFAKRSSQVPRSETRTAAGPASAVRIPEFNSARLVREAIEKLSGQNKKVKSKETIENPKEIIDMLKFLGSLGAQEAILEIVPYTSYARYVRVRHAAIEALGSIGGEQAVLFLAELARHLISALTNQKAFYLHGSTDERDAKSYEIILAGDLELLIEALQQADEIEGTRQAIEILKDSFLDVATYSQFLNGLKINRRNLFIFTEILDKNLDQPNMLLSLLYPVIAGIDEDGREEARRWLNQHIGKIPKSDGVGEELFAVLALAALGDLAAQAGMLLHLEENQNYGLLNYSPEAVEILGLVIPKQSPSLKGRAIEILTYFFNGVEGETSSKTEAAVVLAVLGNTTGLDYLLQLWKKGEEREDGEVLDRIESAMAILADPAVVPVFSKISQDPARFYEDREIAISVLSRIGDKASIEALEVLRNDKNSNIRQNVYEILYERNAKQKEIPQKKLKDSNSKIPGALWIPVRIRKDDQSQDEAIKELIAQGILLTWEEGKEFMNFWPALLDQWGESPEGIYFAPVRDPSYILLRNGDEGTHDETSRRALIFSREASSYVVKYSGAYIPYVLDSGMTSPFFYDSRQWFYGAEEPGHPFSDREMSNGLKVQAASHDAFLNDPEMFLKPMVRVEPLGIPFGILSEGRAIYLPMKQALPLIGVKPENLKYFNLQFYIYKNPSGLDERIARLIDKPLADPGWLPYFTRFGISKDENGKFYFNGQEITATSVRTLILLNAFRRYAVFLRLLHDYLQMSGDPEQRSDIFTYQNLSPLTIFDYQNFSRDGFSDASLRHDMTNAMHILDKIAEDWNLPPHRVRQIRQSFRQIVTGENIAQRSETRADVHHPDFALWTGVLGDTIKLLDRAIKQHAKREKGRGKEKYVRNSERLRLSNLNPGYTSLLLGNGDDPYAVYEAMWGSKVYAKDRVYGREDIHPKEKSLRDLAAKNEITINKKKSPLHLIGNNARKRRTKESLTQSMARDFGFKRSSAIFDHISLLDFFIDAGAENIVERGADVQMARMLGLAAPGPEQRFARALLWALLTLLKDGGTLEISDGKLDSDSGQLTTVRKIFEEIVRKRKYKIISSQKIGKTFIEEDSIYLFRIDKSSSHRRSETRNVEGEAEAAEDPDSIISIQFSDINRLLDAKDAAAGHEKLHLANENPQLNHMLSDVQGARLKEYHNAVKKGGAGILKKEEIANIHTFVNDALYRLRYRKLNFLRKPLDFKYRVQGLGAQARRIINRTIGERHSSHLKSIRGRKIRSASIINEDQFRWFLAAVWNDELQDIDPQVLEMITLDAEWYFRKSKFGQGKYAHLSVETMMKSFRNGLAEIDLILSFLTPEEKQTMANEERVKEKWETLTLSETLRHFKTKYLPRWVALQREQEAARVARTAAQQEVEAEVDTAYQEFTKGANALSQEFLTAVIGFLGPDVQIEFRYRDEIKGNLPTEERVIWIQPGWEEESLHQRLAAEFKNDVSFTKLLDFLQKNPDLMISKVHFQISKMHSMPVIAIKISDQKYGIQSLIQRQRIKTLEDFRRYLLDYFLPTFAFYIQSIFQIKKTAETPSEKEIRLKQLLVFLNFVLNQYGGMDKLPGSLLLKAGELFARYQKNSSAVSLEELNNFFETTLLSVSNIYEAGVASHTLLDYLEKYSWLDPFSRSKWDDLENREKDNAIRAFEDDLDNKGSLRRMRAIERIEMVDRHSQFTPAQRAVIADRLRARQKKEDLATDEGQMLAGLIGKVIRQLEPKSEARAAIPFGNEFAAEINQRVARWLGESPNTEQVNVYYVDVNRKALPIGFFSVAEGKVVSENIGLETFIKIPQYLSRLKIMPEAAQLHFYLSQDLNVFGAIKRKSLRSNPKGKVMEVFVELNPASHQAYEFGFSSFEIKDDRVAAQYGNRNLEFKSRAELFDFLIREAIFDEIIPLNPAEPLGQYRVRTVSGREFTMHLQDREALEAAIRGGILDRSAQMPSLLFGYQLISEIKKAVGSYVVWKRSENSQSVNEEARRSFKVSDFAVKTALERFMSAALEAWHFLTDGLGGDSNEKREIHQHYLNMIQTAKVNVHRVPEKYYASLDVEIEGVNKKIHLGNPHPMPNTPAANPDLELAMDLHALHRLGIIRLKAPVKKSGASLRFGEDQGIFTRATADHSEELARLLSIFVEVIKPWDETALAQVRKRFIATFKAVMGKLRLDQETGGSVSISRIDEVYKISIKGPLDKSLHLRLKQLIMWARIMGQRILRQDNTRDLFVLKIDQALYDEISPFIPKRSETRSIPEKLQVWEKSDPPEHVLVKSHRGPEDFDQWYWQSEKRKWQRVKNRSLGFVEYAAPGMEKNPWIIRLGKNYYGELSRGLLYRYERNPKSPSESDHSLIVASDENEWNLVMEKLDPIIEAGGEHREALSYAKTQLSRGFQANFKTSKWELDFENGHASFTKIGNLIQQEIKPYLRDKGLIESSRTDSIVLNYAEGDLKQNLRVHWNEGQDYLSIYFSDQLENNDSFPFFIIIRKNSFRLKFIGNEGQFDQAIPIQLLKMPLSFANGSLEFQIPPEALAFLKTHLMPLLPHEMKILSFRSETRNPLQDEAAMAVNSEVRSPWRDEILAFTPQEREVYERARKIKGLKIGFDIEKTITTDSPYYEVYDLKNERPGRNARGQIMPIDYREVKSRLVAPGMKPLLIGLLENNKLKIITAMKNTLLVNWRETIPFLEKLIGAGAELVDGHQVEPVAKETFIFTVEGDMSIEKFSINGIELTEEQILKSGLVDQDHRQPHWRSLKPPVKFDLDVLVEDRKDLKPLMESLGLGRVLVVPAYTLHPFPEQVGEKWTLKTSLKHPNTSSYPVIDIYDSETYHQNVAAIIPTLTELEQIAATKQLRSEARSVILKQSDLGSAGPGHVQKIWNTSDVWHHDPNNFIYAAKFLNTRSFLENRANDPYYSLSIIGNGHLNSFDGSTVGLIFTVPDASVLAVLKHMEDRHVGTADAKSDAVLREFIERHRRVQNRLGVRNVLYFKQDSPILTVTPEALLSYTDLRPRFNSPVNPPRSRPIYAANNEVVIANDPKLVPEGILLIYRDESSFHHNVQVMSQMEIYARPIKEGRLPVVIVGTKGADLSQAKKMLLESFPSLAEMGESNVFYAPSKRSEARRMTNIRKVLRTEFHVIKYLSKAAVENRVLDLDYSRRLRSHKLIRPYVKRGIIRMEDLDRLAAAIREIVIFGETSGSGSIYHTADLNKPGVRTAMRKDTRRLFAGIAEILRRNPKLSADFIINNPDESERLVVTKTFRRIFKSGDLDPLRILVENGDIFRRGDWKGIRHRTSFYKDPSETIREIVRQNSGFGDDRLASLFTRDLNIGSEFGIFTMQIPVREITDEDFKRLAYAAGLYLTLRYLDLSASQRSELRARPELLKKIIWDLNLGEVFNADAKTGLVWRLDPMALASRYVRQSA